MAPARNLDLNRSIESTNSDRLLDDVRSLVEKSRSSMAGAVNSELVMLYWHVGRRIREEIITEDRADYGSRNLFNMMRFAEDYQDPEIVQTLSAQLSWSHFIEIIYLKDPLQRQFYAKMARQELEALLEEERMAPDLVFRDQYILDFLGWEDTYSERTWRRPFSGSGRDSGWS